MVDLSLVLSMVALLFLKHFIIDFPLQIWAYQYANKGTYGHPGGLLHSGLHVLGTALVMLSLFGFGRDAIYVTTYISLLDGIIHYHIDWTKMNLNKKFGWGPTTHNEYWVLLGFDQLLHALTYILLVYLVLS